MASTSKDLEPQPLSEKDHRLLNYLEQEYLRHGAVPTKEKCLEVKVTDVQHWNKCIKSKDFRHALVIRGISLRGYDLNASEQEDYVLSEEQLVTANIMLDLRDNRSQKNKLKDCGVSTAKWEGWLRDPAFQSYIRGRAESLLGDNLHESHLALLDRVRSGDMVAIKYFNEITGRYVPNANDKADVNAVLMLVLEVIQREVRDPEILGRISQGLMAIGRKNVPVRPNVIEGSVSNRVQLSVGSSEDGLTTL